jgi:hypothetical protein
VCSIGSCGRFCDVGQVDLTEANLDGSHAGAKRGGESESCRPRTVSILILDGPHGQDLHDIERQRFALQEGLFATYPKTRGAGEQDSPAAFAGNAAR